MHFYKERGKPQLDAKGNLILSKNRQIVTTTRSSAGPTQMQNARYIMIRELGFRGKLAATLAAISWIWGSV